MATSDPKMDEITFTTASQELAAQQSQDLEMEDSDQDSSSEFSTTEDSAVDSPRAKRIALARVVTNAGVFNYGGFCGGQSQSKAYCTCKSRNQCRISGEKQRSQWDAKDYTGTNKGRTWSICCSVGFITLGTRATGTQCYVYKQTTKGHNQRYLKWKEDNQTPGLFNSTMAAIVHLSIWKTCKIHTTYQEIDNDGSVTKCSSVYFYGSIADRRTYLYCRADYL